MNSKTRVVEKSASKKPEKSTAKVARPLLSRKYAGTDRRKNAGTTPEGHRDGVPGHIAKEGEKSSARENASASAHLASSRRAAAPERSAGGSTPGVPRRVRREQRQQIKSNPAQVEYFKDIVATIREPLVVLDSDLRVLSANRSFYKFFKVKAGEAVGTLIYVLGNRQWDIPALRLLLETILTQKAAFDE